MSITSPSRRAVACALVAAVFAITSGCAGSDSESSGDPDLAGTSIPDSSSQSGGADSPSGEAATDPLRLSDGCETDEPPALPDPEATGDVGLAIEVDGQHRTYRLGVPAEGGDGEPMGLIVNFHGATSDAIQTTAYTQMALRGTERGYVVVTPDAVDGHWDLSGEGPDDDLLLTLLDDVASRRCIDLDRVHAVGISLGAWKASVTACTHPDRFASLVLVAEEVAPEDCAMPVVAVHGTADAVVPYGSGADDGVVVTGANAVLPGVEVNMPNWARQAGCSEEKDVTRIEPDVKHWAYRGCPPGFDVELYSIEGGGHTWPGSPLDLAYLGATTHTIDATAIALDWFDAHPMRP